MDPITNLRNGLESSNVEVLKYNEHGDSHEKIDRQAFLEKIERQNHMKSVAESIKEYSWEEKFEWMHQKKLKGNRLFNKKKIDEAIKAYMDALTGIDNNCSEEKKTRMVNELTIPCMLNLGTCMKQKKQYPQGLELCNRAITLNKKHNLSYIRRGMIYQAMKEYDKALIDFNVAGELGAEETTIAKYIDEIKSVQEKRKMAYKNFFEEGSLYQDQTMDESKDQIKTLQDKSLHEEEAPQILRYNDDLEELNRFGVLKYIMYPIKRSYKFLKSKSMWCKRRNPYEVE